MGLYQARSQRKMLQEVTPSRHDEERPCDDLHPRERLHVPSVNNGKASDSMAGRHDIQKLFA